MESADQLENEEFNITLDFSSSWSWRHGFKDLSKSFI